MAYTCLVRICIVNQRDGEKENGIIMKSGVATAQKKSWGGEREKGKEGLADKMKSQLYVEGYKDDEKK